MGIVIIRDKVQASDIKVASEDYGKYVKIVADIGRKIIAIGGQWHADAEKTLLEDGSDQKDLWGGGIDLTSKNIETVAMVNVRPNINNNSQEILNEEIRNDFVDIVKEKFNI